jgi:hypothetical protein
LCSQLGVGYDTPEFAMKTKPHGNSEEAIRLKHGVLGGNPLSPVKIEAALTLPVKAPNGGGGGPVRWYPQKVLVPGPGTWGRLNVR